MERSIFTLFLSSSLLFFHSNVFLFHVRASESDHHGNAMFKLIHRHSPELRNIPGTTHGPPSSQRERIKQLMHSDNARLRTIKRRLAVPRRKANEVEMPLLPHSSNMVELPMRSAADIGTGQYFVSFRIGKPPRKFIMIADTGSSLTWMKCRYNCNTCLEDRGLERIFHAKTSHTFRTIPCSSDVCKQDLSLSFSLAHCPSPNDPCAYDYRFLRLTSLFFGPMPVL